MNEPQKTRLNFCPRCRSALDGAMCVTGDAQPKPGDYTICLYCLVVLQFGDALETVIPKVVPESVKVVRRNLAFAKLRKGMA